MNYTNEGYYVLVEIDSSKNKKYYYTSDLNLKINDRVLVETPIGLELGNVCSKIKAESEMRDHAGFDQIIRVGDENDKYICANNKKESEIAKKIFNRCVGELKLDMKLVNCCYNFEKSKLLFTYIADDRVDFRDLLKSLSNNFKCRIELRQIGPRDRSKMIGGLGVCGLPLCCSSFLNEFEGVSINMAKNQFLALNIQKLSGQCGKLLCCLKYEDDDYTTLKNGSPKLGQKFSYDGKTYKITSLNVLSKNVRIESEDRESIINMNIDQINKILKDK